MTNSATRLPSNHNALNDETRLISQETAKSEDYVAGGSCEGKSCANCKSLLTADVTKGWK